MNKVNNMGFVRFLCNIGIFLVAFMTTASMGILSYNVVSWGSSSDDAINIAASDTDAVNFYDGIGFAITDLKVNVTMESKPYIRNIFSNNGEWADIALNAVLGTTKSIFMPQVQLDNLGEARTSSIFNDLLVEYPNGANELEGLDKKYGSNTARLGAFVEMISFDYSEYTHVSLATLSGVQSITFNNTDGYAYPAEDAIDNEDNLYVTIVSESGSVVKAYWMKPDMNNYTTEKEDDGDDFVGYAGRIQLTYTTAEGEIALDKDGVFDFFDKNDRIVYNDATYKINNKKVGGHHVVDSVVFSEGYYEWAIVGNDNLSVRMWSTIKYYNPAYDYYFHKFFEQDYTSGGPVFDKNNKPIIKTEVTMIFVIMMMSFIIALIFVIKFPITIIQARITGRKNNNTSIAV